MSRAARLRVSLDRETRYGLHLAFAALEAVARGDVTSAASAEHELDFALNRVREVEELIAQSAPRLRGAPLAS